MPVTDEMGYLGQGVLKWSLAAIQEMSLMHVLTGGTMNFFFFKTLFI